MSAPEQKDQNERHAEVPEKIGSYAIVSELGRGGMGIVYKAYEEALDRYVALKVLNIELARDEDYSKRLLQEAQSNAKLEHPNVASVYSAGKDNGKLYIAMQYIDGMTLSEYLVRHKGPMPVNKAIVIAKSVASALQCAHEAGIIHRDIKPDNIMIDRKGKVRVMDFGLARSTNIKKHLTETGVYLGTPSYSSPEQCETGQLDGRSDIYSLGVVLYEMLSGKVPFEAQTPLSLFKMIVENEPDPLREVNPNISANVADLVAKMMAKKRENRFASAKELLDAIKEIAAANGFSAETPAPSKIKTAAPKKNRLLSFAVGIAALAIVAGVIFLKHTTPESPKPDTESKAPVITAKPEVPAPIKSEKIGIYIYDLKNLRGADGSPELDWLKSGAPDMIMDNLSRIPFLDIFTREQVFLKMENLGLSAEEKSDEATQKSVLRKMGSEIYISGKYIHSGNIVRIMLRVINLGDGKILGEALMRECRAETSHILRTVDLLAEDIARATANLYVATRKTTKRTDELLAGISFGIEAKIFGSPKISVGPKVGTNKSGEGVSNYESGGMRPPPPPSPAPPTTAETRAPKAPTTGITLAGARKQPPFRVEDKMKAQPEIPPSVPETKHKSFKILTKLGKNGSEGKKSVFPIDMRLEAMRHYYTARDIMDEPNAKKSDYERAMGLVVKALVLAPEHKQAQKLHTRIRDKIASQADKP